MICIQVQDAFQKYLSEQAITGIDPLNVFQAFSKGRKEGESSESGEVPDKHSFIEPQELKVYPLIICDCQTATPLIQADPFFRMGAYNADVLISLHVKAEDTTSDSFRETCSSLSSCIYFPQNQLARKIVGCGLTYADSVSYGQQQFSILPEDGLWAVTINLQMVVA